MGISSWIANLLSPPSDSIKWKLGQFLLCLGISILIVTVEDVVLPVAGLLEESAYLTNLLIILSAGMTLLLFRALVRFCYPQLSITEPCLICDKFGGKKDVIHDQLREEIEMHLRIQPSIILVCFKSSFDAFADTLDESVKCCINYGFPVFCLTILLTVVLCLLSPLILASYLVANLFMIAIVLFYSCPLSTLYDTLVYQSRANRQNTTRLFPFVGVFQLYAVLWIFFVVVTSLMAIIRGILMLSPDYLPYASLGVALTYYVWMCYRSFTRKYVKLALKVYKHYKTKMQEKEGTRKEKERKARESQRIIPKDLFMEARNKIMPLRESISILVLKIIPIVNGIYILFLVIMETPGASDRAKAILTLLTTLIPLIYEILFGKDPDMEKLDDETLDETVESVVHEYLLPNSGNGNVGNQAIRNNNEDVNGENGSNNNETGSTSAGNEGTNQELHSIEDTAPLLNYGTFHETGNTARQRTTTSAPSTSTTATTTV